MGCNSSKTTAVEGDHEQPKPASEDQVDDGANAVAPDGGADVMDSSDPNQAAS